jgi:hypothetical protein
MSEKWIQKAIKKPGALKKALHVSSDKNIPASKLKVRESDSSVMKKRKVLAKTLRGFD